MAEKGILFSTPMVQAILDRRKTMTRRVIRPQPIWVDGFGIPFKTADAGSKGIIKCPYPVGTRLYVRETWYKNYPHDYGKYWYRADGEEIDMPTIYGKTVKYGKSDGLKWRSPRYMPKSAARIWLEVTNVRVERLQMITAEDCIAEGIEIEWSDELPKPTYHSLVYAEKRVKPAFIEAFRKLWDSLNAKRGYGWDSNPWVWAIKFVSIKA